jgi:hypothetical protein|tara:strand:+ start:1404 stop:1955 length:552 start_codon:yes stop_codon:yes gene_type:complete
MDTLGPKKFKYVKNILSPDLVEYLSTWSLKNWNKSWFRDDQAPLSFSFHSRRSELWSHLIHHLKSIMEKESNLKLKPIYCYNRIYFGGSELKKHLDRHSCEISATISLKHFYKDPDYKWPICMADDVPVVIKSGDGVIYRGCEVPHWRPIFCQPREYWHHQVFVHYVDLNGPYADKKEEINDQ